MSAWGFGSIARQFGRATSPPATLGIVNTTMAKWKQNLQYRFYGYLYTAPTPRGHIL